MSSQSIDTLTLQNSSNPGENAPKVISFAAQLYSEFGAVGHTPWLIIPAAIWALISCFGIVMNGSVVYVTLRSMYELY